MQYKKTLITGGSGFLGTHLAKYLQSKGHNVIIVDINPSKIKGVTNIVGDFNDTKIMTPIIKSVDVVFHLAALVGVDNCQNNPAKLIQVNKEYTEKFIRLCIKHNVKKFIFTSSSEVYGDSEKIPYTETDVNLKPVSLYGEMKIAVEKYLKSIHQDTKMKIGIVRLFNVYGPNQRPNFVVPIFIKKAIENKDLIIFGDGKQIRCFTYVGDVVIGIYSLLKYEKTKFEIVNLGNPIETNLKELAKTVLKLLPNSTSKIIYKEYGKDGIRKANLEIKRRVPSTQRAKKLLNFQATITIETGIQKIISSNEK